MKLIDSHIVVRFVGILALLFGMMAAGSVASAAPQRAADFTVVIDAGHGGRDPGASANGVREKDVNLGVALTLGDFIKKNLRGVKVVYTRSKDEYVSLRQRADMANAAGANLFISIHVNSVDDNHPERTRLAGVSTHVVGPAKESANMGVVRRENGVISLDRNQAEQYEGFNPSSDESYILFDMMQQRSLQRSIDFAQTVQSQLAKTAGRKDRGVHQDPFWVLWATAAPSVLVELDFITNPNSAKYIASTQGQNKIAKALFNAVRIFYNEERQLARRAADPQLEESTGVSGLYVGDGFAVLGAEMSPMRTVTALARPAIPAKRRRRSSAGRQQSINRSVETASINVCSHAAPQQLRGRGIPQNLPQTAPQTAGQPPAPTERAVSEPAVRPARQSQSAHPSKAPRRNNRRVQTATVVGSQQADSQTAPPTAQPASRTDSPQMVPMEARPAEQSGQSGQDMSQQVQRQFRQSEQSDSRQQPSKRARINRPRQQSSN